MYHQGQDQPFDLPPNEILTTQHTVHRTASRNFSRTPDEPHGALTRAAFIIATVSLVGLVVIVALFLTYRSSVTAQINQLQQAVSNAESSLSKAQATSQGNASSVDGLSNEVSAIEAAQARYNMVCSQALVTQTGTGQFWYPCSATRP